MKRHTLTRFMIFLLVAVLGLAGCGGSTTMPTDTHTPTRTPTLAPGATQISPKDGMALVYVPEGDFLMGSSDADTMAYSNEKPQHTIYLDAYWIDKTEVTNAMYAKCVAEEKCQPPSDYSSYTHNSYYGNAQYDNYPVIYVDWNDAKTYCEWAGGRLPMEAEWEKAARGTDGRTYPWGNAAPTCLLANFWGKDGGCIGDTSEVGSYPAGKSPYGALDMAGNVLEWAADWYDENYYASSPSSNPTGPASGYRPASGQYRVLRGGWWGGLDFYVRSAYRGWLSPDYRCNYLGFRCSRRAASP